MADRPDNLEKFLLYNYTGPDTRCFNIPLHVNHFYFFPLQIHVGATGGYGPPQQLFMWRNGEAEQLYFTYMPFLCRWSGGTAVIEVEPSAATVPAFILMEASVIAHAIKEVQMLSGSAHIVISQRNTSLIFVVFFKFFLATSLPLCEEEV